MSVKRPVPQLTQEAPFAYFPVAHGSTVQLLSAGEPSGEVRLPEQATQSVDAIASVPATATRYVFAAQFLQTY